MTKELENLEFGFFPLFNLSSEHSLQISGIALAEGIWKNVVYSPAEIEKATAELVGKPIKVEHGQEKEFGSRIVGKVIEALFDKVLKAIKFKANIDDPDVKEQIVDGIYKAVSMSTWMDKVPTSQEGIKEGRDFKFAELSLVKNPACEKCFIFHCEQLSKREEDLSGIGEEIMHENDNEDNKMLEDYSKAYENLEKEKVRKEEELTLLKKKYDAVLEGAEKVLEEKVSTAKELSQVKEQLNKELNEKKEKEELMIKENEEKAKVDPDLEEIKAAYPKDAEAYPYYKELKYPVVCPVCQKSFDTAKEFFKHWTEEHQPKYGEYGKEYTPKYEQYYPKDEKYPYYGKYPTPSTLSKEDCDEMWRNLLVNKMIELYNDSGMDTQKTYNVRPEKLRREALSAILFGPDMKRSFERSYLKTEET